MNTTTFTPTLPRKLTAPGGLMTPLLEEQRMPEPAWKSRLRNRSPPREVGLADRVVATKLSLEMAANDKTISAPMKTKLLSDYSLAKAEYEEHLKGFSNKDVYELQRKAAEQKDPHLAIAAQSLALTNKTRGNMVCVVCRRSLNQSRVLTSCGCVQHYDCASVWFSSHPQCPCGQIPDACTHGREGSKQKIFKLPHVSTLPVPVSRRAVPFPVVLNESGCYSGELWLATTYPLEHSELLVYALSMSGTKIYGLSSVAVFPYALSKDVYLTHVDVEQFRVGNHVSRDRLVLTGRSCELAILVCSEGVARTDERVALTGSIEGKNVGLPGCWEFKRNYLYTNGLLMAAATENVGLPIYQWKDALSSNLAIRARAHTENWDQSLARAWAADGQKQGQRSAPVSVSAAPKKPLTAAQIAARVRRNENRLDRQFRPVTLDGAVREQRGLVSIEKYAEMKKDMLAARRQLGDLTRNLRANAEDAPMAVTGRSPYLRTILCPDEGPISIPDDVMRPHFAKVETITANVVAATSGQGMFIFYPEHPTNLIGYHYVKNNAGVYIYESTIFTAQDLKDAHDYAKRGPTLITARAGGIASGQFALSGNWNVVRVEGFLTEIPGIGDPDIYATCLTNTAEPLDKVGNVLVMDGIALLALTGAFGTPYTRLGDATPYTLQVGALSPVASQPSITDSSQDLQYNGGFAVGPLVILAGTRTLITDVTMNVDSTTGVKSDIAVDCVNNGLVGADVRLDYFDPFGNMILTEFRAQNMTPPGATNTVSFTFSKFINVPAYNLGPLGAVRVRVSVTPAVAQGLAAYTTTVCLTVPLGARSGVNGPVVLAPYTGVTAGSALTISGWANFNLIPNPALRQNLQLHYGKYDPGEVQWCKTVLADRQRFEIRSVWNLRDYMNARPLLAEMADVAVHTRAAALSFGDIIGGIKKYFLPVAKSAAINFLTQGTPSAPYIGAAASGRVQASAASGKVYANLDDIVVPKPLGVAGGPLTVAFDPRARAMAMDKRQARRVVKPRNDRIVAFPVIVTHPAVPGGLYEQLYAASNVDIFHYALESRQHAGQFVVQGTDTVPDGQITGNVYLFPINPDVFPNEITMVPGPIVSGHSCDAAIQIVCHGQFQGVLPYAVTGGVNGPLIEQNAYFDRKLAYCRKHKVPLAGNDADADLPLESWVGAPTVVAGQQYHAV